VFATLHTNDAAQAVNRIIDVFSADSQAQIRVQLASALIGVVAQRLLPRIDGGRVAAFEILLATPAVRNLIRDAKAEQLTNVISTGMRQGMQTMDASVQQLVAEGIVAASG
jgi:twitching motility protein PilT